VIIAARETVRTYLEAARFCASGHVRAALRQVRPPGVAGLPQGSIGVARARPL